MESVTLLGWKLSAVEHNVRYLAEFSWNPTLTASDFYDGYVAKLYGENARSLADFYRAYDKAEPVTPGAQPGSGPMYLSPGWDVLAMPKMPASPDELNESGWRARVDGTPAHIASFEKLIASDRGSIAEFESVSPKLDSQGQSWAKLMINRLQCRVLYSRSLIAIDKAVLAFDETAGKQDIGAARKSATPHAREALDLCRKMIENYAKDIRNTGDLGVIAQTNEQVYRMIRGLLFELEGGKPFAIVDGKARFTSNDAFDFSKGSPWPARDGRTKMRAETIEGKPTLQVEIGGEKTAFNSVFVRMGLIDLEKQPLLDFRIRTTTKEPLAIMFQTQMGDAWYCLNLIGRQNIYPNVDALPEGAINDGKWHRVTWNLGKLFSERFGPSYTGVRNMILGSWETPKEPIVVEFQDFALGKAN